MPNVAQVLKQEISRLSKKEVKAGTGKLKRQSVALRKDMAILKRQLRQAQKEIEYLKSRLPDVAAKVDEKTASKARISSQTIKGLRAKLGLSQEDLAKLAGVAGNTVWIWEHKKGRLTLRGNTQKTLLGLRGIGKRKARKMVEERGK